MPLVIVFTKSDLIGPNVSSRHEQSCRSLFGNVPAEVVSGNYSFVCVAYKGHPTSLFPFPAQPKSRRLINELVATTDGVIIAHARSISAPSGGQRAQPRSSPASLAWSVTQRTSRDINVQAAIECVTSFLLLKMEFSYHTVRQSWTKQ